MVPNTVIGMEKQGVWKGWLPKESRPLMQTSSPLGAGEIPLKSVSAGSYSQFLKWAAQDRFLLPEGTCRPHLELTCTPLQISARVSAI